MNVAQIKTAFLSFLHRGESRGADGDSAGYSESETFGEKVRRAYREGKFKDQIRKAEIDYAEGRALDRLY
jgi:hypothetical protein